MTPRINGKEIGLLGFADLLDTPDKRVYVTCGADIVIGPAEAELCWGVDDGGKPRVITHYTIPDETDMLVFDIAGTAIAGIENPIDGSFAGEGVHDVYVRVNYGGSTDDSPHTTATVKCRPPGGPDPVGGTRDINEGLPKPTVTPSPVPDDPSGRVMVIIEGYKVRFPGDRLTVEWGGAKLDPVPSDGEGAIVVNVPREVIERVGGGRVPVSYYIYDVASNWSKYAPYADPDVEIDPGTLVAPQLLYASNAAVDSLIDLEVVGKDHVTVRVPVRNLSIGDVVNAWWEATLPDGSRKAYPSEDLIFDDEDSQFYLDARIDNATVLEAAGGTVKIWYAVKGGATSKSRRYRVSELANVALPAPRVPAAVGDELDPFASDREIEVLVPYNGLTQPYLVVGAHVKVTVIGKAGTTPSYWSDEFDLSSGDLGEDVPFYCPPRELRSVENGTADFFYEITQPTVSVAGVPGRILATPRTSEILSLKIRRAGALPDYPAPSVDDVSDGRLDPDLAQTSVRIPLPEQGGPPRGVDVTLSWQGKVPYTTTGKVPVTGQLTFRITRNYIDGNRDSEVSVSYSAGGRPSAVETFFVGTRQVELPPPEVEDAPGGVLPPIKAKDGLKVRIPADLPNGTSVVLHFGSYTTPSITWPEARLITVPAGEVGRRLGTTVPVSYTVNGDRTSPVLQLTVQPIDDFDTGVLPIPTFKELVGDVLDATRTATLHVDPWPLMALGQKVWCSVYGTNTNGQSVSLEIWDGAGLNSDELKNGCNKVLTATWLSSLKDGSEITIEFAVTFDQSDTKENAVTFPIKVCLLRNAPDVDTFDDYEIGQVPTLVTRFFTATGNYKTTLFHIRNVPAGAPLLEGKRMEVLFNPVSAILTLHKEARYVRFAAYNYRADISAVITLKDKAGKHLHVVHLPPEEPQSIEYTASADPVHEIEVKGSPQIDNFTAR
ncbi:MAG TPA: hypothetical protein VGN46_13525 [Luteibacter sp.]|uniref:hypothetical protein n=1 Tax=Luteibacter sp. TaxID=1886636 RepID=UPI002F410F69